MGLLFETFSVPSARDYTECNETKAGIANHLAFGNTHANDANDDWINVASTGSHSTKVLHLPSKSTRPIVKQTYLWEPEALFRQSMMSNAHCVKRVNSCHYSEVKRSRLYVAEDCATTVLELKTWQCSALRKATARLLDVK